MRLRRNTILTWAVFIIAVLLIFFGATGALPIIKADPENGYIPDDPPKLTEVSEFQAIKLFGGTGITHQDDGYPQQNEYTGVCFA